MSMPMITVDGKPFFGRVEEQKRFRAVLQEVLNRPRGKNLPYVFLLYGDGGIGKTTLTKRFHDIATQEPPFAGRFQTLRVDWEEERNRFSALQVGRAFISPETVFDVLYTIAQRQDWGKHFSAYQQVRQEREAAEKKAAEALASAGERDDFAPLRSAGAAAIARILRAGLPIIGETGEKLAAKFLAAGIRVGAEQAAELRAALENRLRARLSSQQFDLFVNPHEGLARALAAGLKRLTRKQPLLLVLDTYEIVDRADIWLRTVMKAAGPHLVWVVSGRDDLLNSRRFGDEFFRGYIYDFPRRLVPLEMGQLALQDVRAYFAARVPQRPLEAEAAEAISRATRAIPLAVDMAAEMWARNIPLEDIVGNAAEAVPQGEIVARMSERYLLHALQSDEDRRALFALTLARGNVEILGAMLRPDEGPFDLERLLRRLERDYASVYAAANRLHDEPALFFRQCLKAPVQRAAIQDLIRRAIEALRERLARLEAGLLPLIEERCQDEDWVKAALEMADYLFWLQDENQAWQWLFPRFVEGWAYSRDLQRGLLAIAGEWAEDLSAAGKKRLKALRVVEGEFEPEEEAALFRELEKAAHLGWLAGEGQAEREAILAWRRGLWLVRQKRYEEALTAYQAAERGLPANGQALRERLAEALDDLAEELMWPEEARTSVYHKDAVPILQKVTAWLPEKGGAWYRLGVALDDAGQPEQTIAAYQQAIALDPKLAYPWHGLGIVYRDLGRHEEAIAAYQKAIALDPKLAYPWNGLGNVYRALGRHEEAIAAFQKAIALDPKFVHPWHGLGNVYRDLGRHEEAIAAYQKAIALDPKDAHPWNGLGLLYKNQGEYKKAIEHCNKALEIDPKHKWAYANLGDVYRKQDRHEEALAAYQQAIALDPKYAYPWHGLGNVYRALGRHEEAIAAYQKAIALDPKYATPWNGLGLLYENQGEYEKAIEHYNKALEIDPKYEWAYANLGDVYRKQGRHEEAIAAYQQAIELAPASESAAFAYNNLAGIFMEKGQFTEARNALNKRIQLYPGNTFAPLVSLGVLARHEGLPESEEHFRQALVQWEKAWQDRLQTTAELLENKAKILLCVGKKDEALETLAEALRQRYPGGKIEFTDYELLRTAPNPPDGIEEAIALLQEAQNS